MYSEELQKLFKGKRIEVGDSISVKAEGMEVIGELMPRTDVGDADTLVIKLSNGYNIGISKKNVKEITRVSPAQKSAGIEVPPIKKNPKLQTISILHTGGTIASKVDYRTGGVTARFTPQEILEMFPELNGIANIESRLIRNMWSEDMRFAHYNLMAQEIEKEVKKGVDGIIITHGTDTMHYSAAALAFALEGLSVPVMLVGAQRSSDRGSTDAASNLINAAYFIANSDFAGVSICMHENSSDDVCLVLPATKTRKMHTSRRDAFRPINTTAIARVNYKKNEISFIAKDHAKRGKGKLALKLFNDKLRVGLLKTHTNMYAAEVSAYNGFDGLVIEGFALGHAQINKVDEFTEEHPRILAAISDLCKRMPVVMASQCIYGRLQMDVYSTGRDLQAAGVVGNLDDMTPETTFIKLAWLLSNFKKEEVAKLMTTSLRGEITSRSEYHDTFLM
jgi:glutamyl-tRNA(Gln) amidotransferase subunit D